AIQMRLGNQSAACDLLERGLEVNPNDATTRFMLEGLRGNVRQADACPEYVHDLFNHYALYYDKHMEQNLQYAIPKRLWALLHERPHAMYARGLDLGCGTGLSGMVLRPLCKHLTGVDLSEKMVTIAREKKIYDDLIAAELLHFLHDNTQRFDLIVAADVLPYFGHLEPLFRAVKSCLAPHALFWFTTEISSSEDWLLQNSIRFCHHPKYIHRLCEQLGLMISHQETMVARQQEGKDLLVNLYAIRM
ncbi:MAG TPA: methyltransferase, partial [Legionellaceae bacterium]|nr:methyltransferase [Legionellaceae bacterium]